MKQAVIMASAFAPIGSPSLGGVNQVLIDICSSLVHLGYKISIYCPKKSSRLFPNANYHECDGLFQGAAQVDHNGQTNDLLINMWSLWEKNKEHFDLTINLSYDILPLEKTKSSNKVILNYISMCHVYDDFTLMLKDCLTSKPWSCCFTNPYQFDTFKIKHIAPIIIGAPIEVPEHSISTGERQDLLWIGRISPEKGLCYAFSIAKAVNRKLLIAGHVQDMHYWNSLKKTIKGQEYRLLGQLEKKELNQITQHVEALVITPVWNEALGLTVLDALAHQTPVFGFDSPGPRWIIQQTGGGELVESKNVDLAALAFNRLKKLDMQATQSYIKTHFSFEHFVFCVSQWISKALNV
jgi:UDP-glucose:tetrahydrobiopterin glucosyltransferase